MSFFWPRLGEAVNLFIELQFRFIKKQTKRLWLG